MPDNIQHLNAHTYSASIRTFFKIIESWHLSSKEGQIILGVPKSTFHRYRKKPDQAKLSNDTIERLSYIFGIYKLLHTIYSDEHLANNWLLRHNDNPIFGGHPPLKRMLAGQVADLFVIRQHLDARQKII